MVDPAELEKLKAKMAALAQMESAGGDISGMTLDSVSPPSAPRMSEDVPTDEVSPVSAHNRASHEANLRAIDAPFSVPKPTESAFVISRETPRTVEVPAMPKVDEELRAAKNADIDAFNQRALEMGFRQLVGGLTGTRVPDAVSQLGTSEADLRARRRAMETDALRRMEAENNAARTGAYLEAQTKMGLGREAGTNLAAQRLSETERANKAREELERLRIEYKKEADARRAAAGAAGKAAKDQKEADKAERQGRKDVSELRKEFNAQEPVKTFGGIKSAYGKIAAALKNPSAAGDLSAIFAYMKILDPSSAVRESEFANAQNAAGVPEKIRNQFNRMLNGERLSDSQRRDFQMQAEKLYQVEKGRYDEQVARYRELASKMGADPDDIIKTDDAKPSKFTAPAELDDEDRAAIKWAKENPDNPDAQAILRLHGM